VTDMLKSMNLRSFSTSRFATQGVMGLCQLPRPIGHAIGRWIADLYTAQKNAPLVRAVRANQWMARDMQLTASQLDQAVRDVFRHTAHCYYDFYGKLRNSEKLKSMLVLTPAIESLIQRSQAGNQGAMVVGPHLSNFDLVMLAIAHYGFQAQGVSPEQPPGGYVIQNQIRAETGLQITPASPASLQQAIERMRSGGIVFTGVDRPVPGDKLNPKFFGQPSFLPTGAVRMAIKAEVPVIVVSSWMDADGRYHMDVSEPIPMEKYASRTATVLNNAEAVLEIVAAAVRRFPEQWLMFYPVWTIDPSEVP
jgi:lauroyl/myristoyl acyltransferase